MQTVKATTKQKGKQREMPHPAVNQYNQYWPHKMKPHMDEDEERGECWERIILAPKYCNKQWSF